MPVRRHMYAMFLVATLLLVAGSASGATRLAVTDTTVGPLVEIVVYDGTSLPATVVAGCSESDCLGYVGPLSGTVTHAKNYVGWAVSGGDSKGMIYLYVDGNLVSSARSARLLVWSINHISAGPHTLEAMARTSAGVEGWSTPLTITVIK